MPEATRKDGNDQTPIQQVHSVEPTKGVLLDLLLESASDFRREWRKKFGRKELGLSPTGRSFLYNF